MKKIIFISVLALTILAMGGCKKEDKHALPPATQIGANTFGCILDGVKYKCKGDFTYDLFAPSEGVTIFSGPDNELTIQAKTYGDNQKQRPFYLTFACKKYTTGVYRAQIRAGSHQTFDDFDSKFVITRFDKDVISGTFQLKTKGIVKRYLPPDYKDYTTYELIRVITDGRFDIDLKNKKI